MNKEFSGNVLNNAIVAFTDAVLVLMFRGGIGSSYLLFCGPMFESGGLELCTSITMHAVDCVG